MELEKLMGEPELDVDLVILVRGQLPADMPIEEESLSLTPQLLELDPVCLRIVKLMRKNNLFSYFNGFRFLWGFGVLGF